MQRRVFVRLGAGVAALASFAGGSYFAWRHTWIEGTVRPEHRPMLAAIAAVLLDGFIPADEALRARQLNACVDRVEVAVGNLGLATRQQLVQLIGLLSHAPGRRLIAELPDPWETAPAEEVRRALQDMRTSRNKVRQQTYHALRDLTVAAYFSDPSAWPQIGYPGPRPI